MQLTEEANHIQYLHTYFGQAVQKRAPERQGARGKLITVTGFGTQGTVIHWDAPTPPEQSQDPDLDAVENELASYFAREANHLNRDSARWGEISLDAARFVFE
jgi:hypothetical protein